MKRVLMLFLCVLLATCGGCALGGSEEAAVPEINLSPKPVPDTEGLAFTRAMGVGWNLGNTFDATGGTWIKDEMDIESAWCGVKTTEEVIQAVADAGFHTIRIPVSWHDHVDESFRISEKWLSRVQQVVDWAYERGLYVIINIHHDCEPGYYYPSQAELETSKAYVTAIWTQVAERFRDYDEHLIFENLNEPRLKDTAYEWQCNPRIPEVAESMDCINILNQTMVDAVRAAGGLNETRYIMVSGYDASPEGVMNDRFTLPEDTANDRLIISTHAYIPYSFALQAPGEGGSTAKWDIKNRSDITVIATAMENLYKRFVSKGIPVVMGEFGSRKKADNLSSRVDHAAYYVASAAIRGIPCVWWDNHNFGNSGEAFGLQKRRSATWEYPVLLEAILAYSMK